jgi:hypothetical protein
MSSFHFCLKRSKVVHVSTFSRVQPTRKAVTTTISNNDFECDYWNRRSIEYDLEENIFWFVKLVKGSKGTQYSAESAPALVPALVEHHQLCAEYLTLKTYFSHPRFSHLLLFSNHTHKTEIGIANRWETTKSNQCCANFHQKANK